MPYHNCHDNLATLFEPNYQTLQEYQAQSAGCGNMFTCMIAGALVFWVVLSLSKASATPKHMQHSMHPIYYPSNIIETSARLVHRVSARKASTSVPNGLLSLEQCRSRFHGLPSDVKGPKVIVADGKEPDWKSLKEEERSKIDSALHAFLEKNDDVVIMVFAPWCPHCHKMMPNFVKLSHSGRPGQRFLMVNAETCTRDTFTRRAPGMIHPLQYFPTFLVKKDGKYHEMELNDLTKAMEKDDAVTEDAATDDALVDTPDPSTSDMLAQLF